MKFEWDEAKRRSNIKKHGVDFADLKSLFFGVTVTTLDDRADYGEERFVTVGLRREIVLVVVHTERAGRIRIISARKGTKYEERSFFQKIAH